MSSSSAEGALRDILRSADKIREYIAGITLESYAADSMRRDAVERQLQILTEAAFRLGRDAAKICPDIDWRSIRGMGNFLRHEYDHVTERMIWDAVHEELPALELSVRTALAKMEQGSASA